MRRPASLHAHATRRQALAKLAEFPSSELSSECDLTFLVDRMNLKKILRQIHANSGKAIHGRSPRWWRASDHVLALDAVWVGPSTSSLRAKRSNPALGGHVPSRVKRRPRLWKTITCRS